MIDFHLEVGILGWMSTIVFWVVVVVLIVEIVRLFFKYKQK